MRRTSILGLVVLMAVFITLADHGSQADAVPSPGPGGFKWEYKVYTETELANLSEAKTLEASLNKLGDDGWELVAIRSSNETPAALAKKGSVGAVRVETLEAREVSAFPFLHRP